MIGLFSFDEAIGIYSVDMYRRAKCANQSLTLEYVVHMSRLRLRPNPRESYISTANIIFYQPISSKAMFSARVIPRLTIIASKARFCARSFSTSPRAAYEYIIVSSPAAGVTQVTLNRPKALNALFTPLIEELDMAMKEADSDKSIGAIVITGSEKAFAAGADIKEMKDKTYADVYGHEFIQSWSEATKVRKPVLAAVNGFAVC